MKNKTNTIERTVISVSLSVNDRNKLKELAARKEMTMSALLVQWIRENYEKSMKG